MVTDAVACNTMSTSLFSLSDLNLLTEKHTPMDAGVPGIVETGCGSPGRLEQ
jgi:hypothetical protein